MAKQRNKRKKRSGSGEGGGGGGGSEGGGLMTSMRSGFKNVANPGAKKRGRASRVWDIGFWVLVLAALLYFASRRFG